MKHIRLKRMPLVAATALLWAGLAMTGNSTPAAAQPANAADLCTPDVMRLCNKFIPDANRIVVCLKAKRGQLSPGCRRVMTPTAASASKRKARKVRRH